MRLPTQKQVATATRYAVATVSTIGGITGVAAFLQSRGTNVQQIIDSVNALGTFAAAILTCAGVLGPVIAGVLGYKAAAPEAQIDSVRAIAADPAQPASQAAKVALLDATASLPEVVGEITVTDPTLVANTKSDQVQPAT